MPRHLYLFFFCLLCTTPLTLSRLIWHNAPIYEIKQDLFQKKVIDSYSADMPTEASPNPSTHTPDTALNSNNPYKSNITRFALYNSDFGMAPIPVYNLENVQIKSIDDVFIECYDYDDCHYELTLQDRKELSLYASLIENGGSNIVPETYSLGVIRSKFTSNVLGMYTEGFSQLNNQIGFWIRLESDSGRFYSNLNKHEQLITMLDLAIHERAHYETPTYNNNEAHCDGFQSTYNFLFQQAGRNFASFLSLTGHITNAGEETDISTTDSILIGLLCFVGILAFVFAVMYFRVESNQPRYDNLNY